MERNAFDSNAAVLGECPEQALVQEIISSEGQVRPYCSLTQGLIQVTSHIVCGPHAVAGTAAPWSLWGDAGSR